jgi:hypothetical protein
VAVSLIYNAGLALGFLRPYYLQIQDPMTGQDKYIRYTQEDSALFLNNAVIIGGGGLSKGWGEMKVTPGAFGKFAFRFDYGRFNEVVSGIEVGISAEYYTGDMPVVLLQEEKQFFLQTYIAVLFGRRK